MAPRKGMSGKVAARMQEHQPQLTTAEWAYVAGIFDGEGTISIIRVAKRAHWALEARLYVTNTSEPLMDWLGLKLGMYINGRNRPNDGERRRFISATKTSYQILIPGFRGYHILKNIKPFLIVKQEQAQIVMEFMESRAQQPYNGPYTQNEIDLWLRVRALNHGGFRAYDVEADLTRSFTTSQPPLETL